MPEQEPRVGDRRASTQYGIAAVEEWDGTHWRRVGSAKGDQERDRMLLPMAR